MAAAAPPRRGPRASARARPSRCDCPILPRRRLRRRSLRLAPHRPRRSGRRAGGGRRRRRRSGSSRSWRCPRACATASARPDLPGSGRSTCLGSPQITIRLRMPKRVRNIFICAGVVFCASSRMMKASDKRAAAHEGDRRDLDLARGDPPLDLLGRQHVVERVVERAQIGIDLLLHVAGQEAEPLARLDRRARQDQPVDRCRRSAAAPPGRRRDRSCRCRPGRARRSCRRGPAPPCRRPASWSAGRSSSCACGSSPWAARPRRCEMIPSSVGWPDMAMIASTAPASMSWPSSSRL